MTFYEYKIVPAPKQLKRVKGVKSTAELFCVALSEAINGVARDGWEYLRSESMPAIEEGGLFRRGSEVIETVLVFRRPRETLGPRLATREAIEQDGPSFAASERGLADRPKPAPPRREPSFGETVEAQRPLRPLPRLGPADPS